MVQWYYTKHDLVCLIYGRADSQSAVNWATDLTRGRMTMVYKEKNRRVLFGVMENYKGLIGR